MAGAGAMARKEQRDDGEQAIEQLVSQLAGELDLTDELQAVVEQAGVKLTPAAYLMLLVPIFEGHQLRRRREKLGVTYYSTRADPLRASRVMILRSIETLAHEARNSPAAADGVDDSAFSDLHEPTRSSFSIIKSFWKSFCNIPPFCGEA